MRSQSPLIRGQHPHQRALRLIPNPKLQPVFPLSLRFGPSCFGRSSKGSSGSGRKLLLSLCRFSCRCFALSSHSLRNPSSNVGKSLGAHLPLELLRRFSRCPLDLRPPCFGRCSHLGLGVCTELALLGCFSCLDRSGCLAAQKLTEFLLQRLDFLLDVGCFPEL